MKTPTPHRFSRVPPNLIGTGPNRPAPRNRSSSHETVLHANETNLETRRKPGRGAAALAVFAVSVLAAGAASIPVPNASFESPNVTGIAPYYEQFPTALRIGNWVRYGGFHAVVEGGRYGASPAGLDGTQFGNVTGELGGGLFQDLAPYDGSGGAELYWEAGRTYTLTVGAFLRGDNPPGPGRAMDARLFYRTAEGAEANMLASRTLTVGTDALSTSELTDYTVSWTVGSGAPEVGKPIGIWFTTVAGGSGATGDWGFDNLRLERTDLSGLITSFTANPTSLHRGQSTTLRWEVDAAATVSIEPGLGDVTALTTNGIGSAAVMVPADTTFTLTATKTGQPTETREATVIVKPLILSFTATRPSVPMDTPVGLNWSVHPLAATVTISPEPGDVSAITTNGVGTVNVVVSADTTFTLEVSYGTATESATVGIVATDPPTPPDYGNLVSLYKLNDTAADSFGPNDGTFVGTPTYAAGPKTGTRAAVLNGTSYIKAGQGIAFDTPNAFSATTWIKATPGQDSTVLGRMQQGSGYTGWELHVGSVGAGLLNVWLINAYGASFIEVNSPVNVLDNTWHHVAFTYDGSGTAAGVKIYVDGLDATGSASADSLGGNSILSTIAEFNLGSRQNGTFHNFIGSLHEASVWSTALTPGNVLHIYSNSIAPPVLLASFTADPPTVFVDLPTTLRWEADPGATLVIDNGVGDVTANTGPDGLGSVDVVPWTDTIYTLTATKDGRIASKQVTVGIRPLIASFSATRSFVPLNQNVGLLWSVHPLATEVSIAFDPGDVTGITTNGVGSTNFQVLADTQFILNVTYGGLLASTQIVVTVTDPPAATAPDEANLVSLWPLDGDTLDLRGLNHGTFVPEASYGFGPDLGEQAALFPGNAYIKAGQGIAFDTSDPFSVTAWMRGSPEQDSAVVGRMRQGGAFTGWELHVGTPINGSGPGRLNVWLIDTFGSAFIQVNSPPSVLDDQWHHVAFTYDGSSLASGVKIYVDGFDATGDVGWGDDLTGKTILPLDAELNFGSRQNGANHTLRGALQEVSVWDTVLTPENIGHIYLNGVARPPRLTDPQFVDGTQFRLSWTSEVGHRFTIERTAALPGGWTPLETDYPAGGATGAVTAYTNSISSGAGFYRVLRQP